MLDPIGQALKADLMELFQAGVDSRLDASEFDRLALRIFEYQFERNTAYAAYCQRRGRTPATVTTADEIPAVPSAAFKEVPLVCGPPDAAEAVFRTSGTTRGPERRGEHYILDLTVYHASLLPTFAAYVLPDAVELPILSLMPSSAELPDSSLAHMISVVMDRLGAPGSRYFATVDGGLDTAALDEALHSYAADGTPVCLVGTSLAFDHWLERLEGEGRLHRLPPGSRLMDTGGFKGRKREVPPAELYARYQALLGLTPESCVNEYGMTEMCSQFYDGTLRDRVRARRGPWPVHAGTAAPQGASALRRMRPPPWVRTSVVDPDTLEPLPTGATGLLRHLDLANLGSVACIQTEDLGRQYDDGSFELLGRAAGAPPRGCSIAMDLLLEAARGGSAR